MFNLFNTNKIEYKSLQADIINCLGKSLKDNELKNFIDKYKIDCEDKYNDKLFICQNDFLQFQNRDQRRQKINEFHIRPNDKWLPYGIVLTDTIESVSDNFGEPDLIDYDFNVFYYYDKLIMISFVDVKNRESTISKITFSSSLKNKPTEEELVKWKEERLINSTAKKSKVFGLNSKWLIVQSNDIQKALNQFGITRKDKTNWEEGFKKSSIRTNGIFISKILSDKILIYGWSLPEIEKHKEFYIKLNNELGTVFYFENHIKTPFAWAKINNGLIERVFREEYFEILIDTGYETEFELSENFKSTRISLIGKNEKYISDQDIKLEYRKYINDFVIRLASNWIFDPRTMDTLELPDIVYLNKNYRQHGV